MLVHCVSTAGQRSFAGPRLFVRTVWLEDCAQEEQRESEEEDAEAAIAEHEKDRSGLEGARRRRRKFGG